MASRDSVIFKPDCIFCNKEGRKAIKSKNTWTTEATTVFEDGGWESVLEIAERNNDETLLRRIRGFDLFACEAHYHPTCRKKYTKDPLAWRSKDHEAKQQQNALENSHKAAFSRVCSRIEEEILNQQNIVRLSELCCTYITALSETDHPNPQYRNQQER